MEHAGRTPKPHEQATFESSSCLCRVKSCRRSCADAGWSLEPVRLLHAQQDVAADTHG